MNHTIAKVTLQNFKGRTGAIPLAGANLIVAPNFTGKTALLEAIKLVLLRYIPGRKALKTNPAIFKRASAGNMSASITMTGGETYAASYTQAGRSIQATGNAPEWVDDGMRFALDPELYFSKSIGDRIEIAAQLLAHAGGITIARSVERVMSAAVALPKKATEAERAAARDAAQAVLAKLQPMTVKAEEAKKPLPVWLTELAEYLGTQRKTANAVKERMQKTLEGITDLADVTRELETIPPVENLTESEARIDGTIAEIRATIAKMREPLESDEQRIKTRDSLTRQINDITADAGALEGVEVEERNEAASVKNLEEMQGEYETLRQADTDARALHKVDYDAAKKRVADMQERAAVMLKEARAVIDRYEEEALNDGGMVPFDKVYPMGGVHSLPDGEHTVSAVLTIEAGKINVVQIREILVRAKRTVTPEEIAAALQKEQEAESLDVEAELLADRPGYFGKDQARIDYLATTITEEKTYLEKCRARLANARQCVTSYNAAAPRLAELRARVAALKGLSAEDVHEANCRIDAEEAKIAALHAERQGVQRQRERIAELRQAQALAGKSVKENEKAAAEVSVLKRMEDEIEGIRLEGVKDSIQPALDICNKFADGVLRSPIIYNDGEIGRMQDGVFIDITGFSGAEEALLLAGFGVALASRSAFRCPILDELSDFDAERKHRLLQNCVALVEAGVIDQFIAVDNTLPGNVVQGLNVIHASPAKG